MLFFGSVFGYEHVLDPFYKKLGFSEKPFDVMENATSLFSAFHRYRNRACDCCDDIQHLFKVKTT